MMKKLLKDKQGVSAVEMALVIPVLLLFVGGIIDFGNAYWYGQTLTWASRVGAREAIVQTADTWNADAIKAKVVKAVKSSCGKDITADDVTLDPEGAPLPGGDITVSVTMPFNYHFLPLIGVQRDSLSGETTMAFEPDYS
ncbi:MAG: TadE/TadG family type IV pilus assembly protein [Desulfobacteraceae bacterium]